jgi:hypothetical protein
MQAGILRIPLLTDLLTSETAPAMDAAALAAQLDREADFELQAGRHAEAERLAHMAAAVREGRA